MPQIWYSVSNFPSRFLLNGEGSFNISWAELVWAAISVGKAELLHIVRYGRFSSFEIAYRTAILFANLREDAQGYIRRSSAYDGLDPSEKGAISYFLGLVLAKVFSQRFLEVPWLMHLDVYRQSLQAILNSRSKPDLVGQNRNGDWIIMESKGRTNGFDSGALEKAKEQATQVIAVSGSSPVLHVGLQIHFGDGTLHLVAEDPKPKDSPKRQIKLPLSKERFFEGYYRPFKWIMEAPEVSSFEWQGINYRMVTVQSTDVDIAIAESVLRDGVPPHFHVPSVPSCLPEENENPNEDPIFAGQDGLLVRVGSLWSGENMRREPQERH